MNLFDSLFPQRTPGGKYIFGNKKGCSKPRRSGKQAWKSSDSIQFEQSSTDLTGASSSDDESFSSLGSSLKAPPDLTRFYGSHCLCNYERSRHAIAPLKRSRELDTAARWHAEEMAARNKVRHSDPSSLQAHLLTTDYEILGENVAVGDSKGRKCLRNLHEKMMLDFGNFNNIMDKRYTEMGMATHKSKDGKLYICQVFRG